MVEGQKLQLSHQAKAKMHFKMYGISGLPFRMEIDGVNTSIFDLSYKVAYVQIDMK